MRNRKIPTPGFVISCIALIVAVGGGTYALATGDSASDKKIANRAITKRAPKLSVKSAGKVREASVGTVDLLSGTGNQEVLSAGVPKGTYLIVAKGWIDNNVGATAVRTCNLLAGSQTLDTVSIGLDTNGASDDKRAFSLQGATKVPGDVTLSINCSRPPNDSAQTMQNLRLDALPVAGIAP